MGQPYGIMSEAPVHDLAFHTGVLCWVLATLLHIYLWANVSGNKVEDGANALGAYTHVGDPDGVLGSQF